jgi:hypothetical protein
MFPVSEDERLQPLSTNHTFQTICSDELFDAVWISVRDYYPETEKNALTIWR